jgi:hypothetical protein
VTNDGAGSCTYFVKSGGAVIGSGGGGDNVAYAEPGATVTLPGLSVVTVPNVSQSPVASLFQITPPGPAVVTGNAVNVEFTDATVNGTVNPEFGGRTTTYFQYGTSTSYGSQSAAQNTLGAGQQTSPVSATLTGLLPNTLYHYQLVASNAGGTDNGADETFTTGSLPGNGSPGVLNEPANGATCNAVTLNAAVDANGVATNVTFEYGLTNAYGTTTAAQPIGSGTTDVAVSGSLSGLTPNTTYHYCVVAANGNGTTTGTDETFQTGAVGIFSFSPAQGGPGATLTLQGVGFTTTTGVVFESEIGASATASYVVLSDTEMTVTVPNAESRSEGCYITVLTSAGATVTVDPTLTVVENGDVTTAGGGATVYVEGGGVATNDGSGSDTYFIMSGGVLNGSGGGGGNVAYVEAGASVTLGGVTTVAEPVISQSPVTAAFQYISPARAVTGTCSGIAMNAATVSGTVNPEGSIATAYIAYGPETGSNGANAEAVSLESADSVYTSQTASESIGSGTSDLPLSLNLTGLTSNTLYHYSVVVSNSAGMTYGADEEFTTAPSPYNIWDENEFTTAELSNQVMSGATGDPMGDGVSNLMKYALGLNPMVGTTAGLPVSGTAVINGTNCHTFTYTKVDAATDITYHPEWSSDLATWTNTGLTEVVLSDNGTTQVVQDSLPVSGTGPVFFHLRVTMP